MTFRSLMAEREANYGYKIIYAPGLLKIEYDRDIHLLQKERCYSVGFMSVTRQQSLPICLARQSPF